MSVKTPNSNDKVMSSQMNRKSLLAAALCLAAIVPSGAAPFAYNNGDLILGFRASVAPGLNKNVFVNLGPGPVLRDSTSPGVVANIGTTLSAAFGNNWYARSDVHFGVLGNLNNGAPTGGLSTPPVAGDPSRTFYISLPAAAPGTAALVPELTYPSAALGSAATKLGGMEEMLAGTGGTPGFVAEADGSMILDQFLHPVQWANGWSTWNPVPGAALDVFTGGIQQTFGKASPSTHADIQRLLPTNVGANPSGVEGGGTYVTTLSISNTGEVSLNTAPPTTEKAIALSGDLAFGDVVTGGSTTRVLTISNAGTDVLNVTGIAYPAGFSGDWSGAIPIGGTENVTVTFTPTQVQAYSGQLTVASDKDSGTETHPLSGNGVAAPTRILGLSGNLAFGEVIVGTTSQRTLTLSNQGTAPLAVTGISLPAGFSGTFAGTIPAGGSRMVEIAFAPTTATNFQGSLEVASDRTGGDDSVPVSGSGVIPPTPPTRIISVEGNFSFGTVTLGRTANRVLTISNSGTGPLTVSGINTPAGFSANWSGTLAPGASRTVTVSFTPTRAREVSGNLRVLSDKTSGTDTIGISVSGAAKQTRIIALTGGGTFGTVAVGGMKRLEVMIGNSGNSPLIVREIRYPEGFSGEWTGRVPPGGMVRVPVFFSPTEEIVYRGRLTLVSNSTSGPSSLQVVGRGISGPVIAVEQPTGSRLNSGFGKRSFGTSVVGQRGMSRLFTLRNDGISDLVGLSVDVVGEHSRDFIVTAPGRRTLRAGESVTFRIAFRPAAKGLREATLRVNGGGTDSPPFTISLGGMGS
jgi:hypothetical protein